MAKKKIKLIEIGDRTYEIPLTDHAKSYNLRPAVIKIGLKWGMFHYHPRAYTFMEGTTLSSEELRSIADELDRLNKDASLGADE